MYASGPLATRATASVSQPGEPIIPEVVLLGKELIFLVELDFLLPAPDVVVPDPGGEPDPEPGDPVIVDAIGSAVGTATVAGVGDTVSGEQITGFVFPTSGAVVNDGGNIFWNNPGNVVASDQARATTNRSAPGTSQWLYCSGFNFSTVPDGVPITAIDVLVEKSKTGAAQPVVDNIIQLTKNGTTLVGLNKADTVSDWPSGETDQVVEYNFPASEAGNPTVEEIKSPTFGVIIKVQWPEGVTLGVTARVDAVSVQIHYGGAAPPVGSPGGTVDGTGSASGSATVEGVGDTVGGTGGSGTSFTTGFDSGFG